MTFSMPSNQNQKTTAPDPRLLKLAQHLPTFAKSCLKIVDKSGRLVPLEFNRGQLYLHERIEKHAEERNDITRIVVVKGRQGGYSTYVNARNYHRTLFSRGRSTYILAHLASASQQMFRMINTFHDNLPQQLLDMFPVKTSNRNQFEIENTNSRILVGTAGSETSGRGNTIQSLHGSEVAFWQSPDDIITGLFNTVPDLPNTSVILESTANGVGTFFHNMAAAGLAGDSTSAYETVFCPWFWQPEYSSPVPADFKRTDDEHELHELYGLTDGQLVWRRRKLHSECHGVVWKFQQEYPCCLQEAFVSSEDSLFPASLVLAAKKSTIRDDHSPIVIGVDPAEKRDRFAIVVRQGKRVLEVAAYRNLDVLQQAYQVDRRIRGLNADRVFIDCGTGYSLATILQNDYGHRGVISPVLFGAASNQPEIYQNKRAEMYYSALGWFEEGGTSIPDDDVFANELLAIPSGRATRTRGVIGMPPKEEISLGGNSSPDLTDAFVMTFAHPVLRRRLIHTMSTARGNSTTIRGLVSSSAQSFGGSR